MDQEDCELGESMDKQNAEILTGVKAVLAPLFPALLPARFIAWRDWNVKKQVCTGTSRKKL
jgi:hypothetical protein